MADRQNNNAKRPSDGARAAAIVFGGIFIVIALLYILKATGVYPDFTLLHLGTLVLIPFVPTAIWIFAYGAGTASVTLLCIEFYIFLAFQEGLGFLWHYFVPAVMLILGFAIFSRSRVFRYRRVIDSESGATYSFPIVRGFLGRRVSALSDNEVIYGAFVRVFLGSARLDLSGAQLAADSVVEVRALLGTCEVRLPEYSNVVISGLPLASTLRGRKTAEINVPNAPTVYVRMTMLFGSLEVTKETGVL